jgi:alpha-D-ribose 1-methylphosphonate 5-triphosphate diphosphatase
MRSCQEAEKLVRLIHRFTLSGRSRVRHRIHARYEITSPGGVESVGRLLEERLVHMASLMDHTPGQGQFRTLESYMAYKMGTYRVSAQEVMCLVEYKTRAQEGGWRQVAGLAGAVRAAGIPFLSHDDDSAEKVALVRELGVTGSEFPLNIETARAAKVAGLTVLMGAPNLIRDRSSNGHLRASEAVAAALCDGLMSDYYPECLVEAPFSAMRRGSGWDLGGLLRLVTSGPGDFLAPGDNAGRLVPGGPADIALIDVSGPWTRVTQTWVGGRCVFHSKAR